MRETKCSRLLIIGIFLLLGLVYSAAGYTEEINLTLAERAWLNEHPVIRIAPDPDFAPYEWLSADRKYYGIAADYMRLIEARLGIKFTIIPTRKWSEVVTLLQRREADVQPALANTALRRQYMLFTRTYTSFPGVVVSGKEYRDVEELYGHKVAVVRGNYWDELLTTRKPDITVQHVDTTAFGLELTALGAVDAMLTDLASATAEIQRMGITNLFIVGDPDNRLGRLEHAIAVRSDWPELRLILDKVLASITREESETILFNWIKIEEPDFWYQRDFRIVGLASLAVTLLLFTGFFIWNRALKASVERRTGELRAVQAQLMQADKMESIGRLAASVAHEVKNPLAIIQMGVDYLARSMPKDATTLDVIRDIDDAVQRADTVIHGLLDFSRDKKLTLASGNINDVISNALHLVDHELRQRNITVKLTLAETLPPMALDANKLQQVFINLFMNAVHAMKNEGKLLISSQSIVIRSKSDVSRDREGIFDLGERIIQVEVADTGPGIREQDKAKIFDLFYTSKGVGEGTGLGLSVSHNIIKLHNGSIDIANRIEGGASVVMLFRSNGGDE